MVFETMEARELSDQGVLTCLMKTHPECLSGRPRWTFLFLSLTQTSFARCVTGGSSFSCQAPPGPVPSSGSEEATGESRRSVTPVPTTDRPSVMEAVVNVG